MPPIKKEVKFEVDYKKLTEALKTFKQISDSLKTSIDFQKKILEYLDKTVQKGKESRIQEEKKTATLKTQERLQKNLLKIREEYERQKERRDFELKFEQRKLEKPKMGFLEQYQKYKGISGSFLRLRDLSSEQGEEYQEKLDRELFTKKEERQALLDIAKKAKSKKAQKEAYEKVEAKDIEIENIEKEKSKTKGETQTQMNKYVALAQAASNLDRTFKRLSESIIHLLTKPFKDLVEGIRSAVTAMLSFESGVATYNMSTSLITNATAREQQMKYGLTTPQNYAFTQAKSMLGIRTDEDLMYMNIQQREKFLQYMERYSAWYEQIESSGVLERIQDMQLQFNELKQQIAMEFLEWVAENKEAIMTAIKGTFEFVKVIAKIVLDIVGFISKLAGKEGNYSVNELGSSSDSINNDNRRNTNITINANTTNNATGVLGSQEALDQFNKENWSNLAKQIVGAIGG